MDDVCRAGHPNRKLTPDDVRMIRRSNVSTHIIAEELGVNQRTVWNIRKNFTYRYEGR
jgi:DNA-binding transcriptional regulator YiaG